MPHLLRHVGERMARYLLLTGELIDAAEACALGLINAVASARDCWPGAGLGAVPAGGRPAGAGRDEGTAASVLAPGGVGARGAPKPSAAPRLTRRVPARAGGVLRQAAGAVGSVVDLLIAPPHRRSTYMPITAVSAEPITARFAATSPSSAPWASTSSASTSWCASATMPAGSAWARPASPASGAARRRPAPSR